MKKSKTILSILSGLLITSMLLSTNALAAGVKPIVNLDRESFVNTSEIVPVNGSYEILGTQADETGYFLPDNAMYPASVMSARVTYSTLFSVTAAQVYNMLTSRGANKYFFKDDLTNGGLCIRGTLNNSYTYYNWAEAGVCIYDDSSGYFYSVEYDDFQGGVTHSVFFEEDCFEDDVQYYAYVKNPASNVQGSYVYGSLTYYNSSNEV